MTNEQINIAISEACGFLPSAKGDWYHTPEGNQLFVSELPDYCRSLDAMRTAEELVCRDQTKASVYESILASLSCSPVRATAREKAEAFLKTIGRWSGEPSPTGDELGRAKKSREAWRACARDLRSWIVEFKKNALAENWMTVASLSERTELAVYLSRIDRLEEVESEFSN